MGLFSLPKCEADRSLIAQVNGSTNVEAKMKKEVKREREASVDDNDGSDVEFVAHHNKKSRTTARRGSSVSIIDLCGDE